LKLRYIISALSLPALATGTVYGADLLLETQTSWNGGTLIYPAGKAQVTSVMLHIEPGDEPPFHCHPVPTMGYVLPGSDDATTWPCGTTE
jgi:quercetin dioxygenase-like cupin family protein